MIVFITNYIVLMCFFYELNLLLQDGVELCSAGVYFLFFYYVLTELAHFQEVESQNGSKDFIDRLYTYREAFDLHVPKVSSMSLRFVFASRKLRSGFSKLIFKVHFRTNFISYCIFCSFHGELFLLWFL